MEGLTAAQFKPRWGARETMVVEHGWLTWVHKEVGAEDKTRETYYKSSKP